MATTTRTPNNIYILNELGKENFCLQNEDEILLWKSHQDQQEESCKRNARDHKTNQCDMQALLAWKANKS